MPMLKQVSLSDIKTFVELAQAGSFTKAAERLNCSRANVSKQLAQLESDLGVTLLVRTTRTQHLTPQGEAFFERCKKSLDGIYHAIDRALEGADALAGTIKINSVGGQIGEEIIAPMVSEFMAQHPNISVDLDFSSRRVDLISGEFDFVFRMGELVDSSLIGRKLTDIEVGVYASAAYLNEHGHPNDPKGLAHHRCITGSLRNWSFINNESKQAVEVTIDGNLTCKNGRIMVSNALAGNGIIRVPKLYCQQEVEQGLLLPLLDDWHVKSTPFYLVYAQDKHQPMRLRAFKEFVMENFQRFL